MTTQSPSIVLSATTTTLHRNWANAISAALTALGLPKTSDTGQIVLTGSTLAYPTTLNPGQANFPTSAGYEIRTMTSSGKPTIYLKIWYGVFYNSTGTGAAYYWPALRIDVGSASNGAGVLTPFNTDGNTFPIMMSAAGMSGSSSASSGKPSASAQTCYLASDGANYLTIALGTSAPSFENSCIMASAMERTNTPGAASFTYDSGGLIGVNYPSPATDNLGTTAAARQVLWDFTTALSYSGASSISAQTTSYTYRPNSGTDCNQYPISVGVGHGPMLSAIAYDTGLLTENSQYSCTLYGAAHNFLPVVRDANYNADPYNTTYLALRFE